MQLKISHYAKISLDELKFLGANLSKHCCSYLEGHGTVKAHRVVKPRAKKEILMKHIL